MDFAYIGSFNYEGSEGISICSYNRKTGALQHLKTVFPEINAGNVCIIDDVLYCTDEQSGIPGKFPMGGGGRIFAFKIDRESGELTLLSEAPTYAINPAHITIDESEKYLIVSHFSIGGFITKTVRDSDGGYHAVVEGSDNTTCLFRRNADGSIGRLCDVYHHVDGEGPVSMIHKAYRQPGRNLYAENDLGADRIYFFSINYEEEKLEYISSQKVCFKGEGPRHGAFHPALPYLYINYERKGAVTRFDIADPKHISQVDEYWFVPDEELSIGADCQSELMFGQEGKILYTFMRGKGLAVVYDVDDTGALKEKQRLKLSVSDPRGADFTPDEQFIVVAGHNAGRTVFLHVKEDGTLEETGMSCEMPHPASTAIYYGGN